MSGPDEGGADAEIARLRRRVRREAAARLEAEAIAEKGLRDLFQRQQEISLLESIAVAANEADDVHEAMKRALEAMCRYAEWPLGNLWLVSGHQDQQGLHATAIWYDEAAQGGSDPHQELRTRTEAGTFSLGAGLPGRAALSGRPEWVATDAPGEIELPRLSLIVGAGFASLVACPVMIANEVVAVLKFFSRKCEVPEESLLRLMAQVGTQLGRVFERRRAGDKLMHNALHDPLTQLGNRRLFLDRIGHLLQRLKRKPGNHFAVLFVDLDRFKSINDGLGHPSGDQLLVATARRLTACLRQDDLVARDPAFAHEHLVARLGGDEFVILLDQIGSAEHAIRVVERIMSVLAEPFEVASQRVFVTASVGVALSATGYANVEDILRDADIAMYHAKQAGRGRWMMFDQAMQLAAVHRLQMEADLRDAMHRQQLFLEYQPIVAPHDGRVRGFEALLRWRHPVHGLVPPARFIPIVEETGLIDPIGAWVLREACCQLRDWQQAFDMHLTMSVNVSAIQFADGGFIDVVTRALAETGIAPASLKLELTETAVMADAEKALAVFAQLKALGVRVSLDDFGTGYSSLSYLRRLPIDTLKIDRSFISKLDCFDDKRQIVEVVLMLARALGMDVVAEGVETEAELALLRDMGSDLVQGYFYYRPLAPDVAAQVLAGQFAPVAMC
ncbi:GGDEF domain-containing protein [Massilia sp. TW-1]|uniref:GGDEF domain-containing protein n=1 Tax=Telluria antibiotica TaxID=2717319 RepID=A0ABX0PKC6_9BURK|nr:GGDEF domain-containing protein [Telluria antibiotica]NIA57906.1 GGDEF domain-containing protein [Telluria antibiotica]